MVLDPAALATRAGYPVTAARILVHRPGRVVARLDGVNEPAVLKADVAAEAFVPEVAAIERLASAGIPVPGILAHESSEPAILILSWTEGRPLTTDSQLSAQREAGQIMRRIHRLGAAAPFSGRPTVDSWIADWLDQVVTWWSLNGGSPTQVQRLQGWHRALHPILKARTGELMLFDCRPEHFLVDDTGAIHLIDLHDLGSGDAVMDFAAIHLDAPLLTPNVLDGYQPATYEREVFDRLIPFFTVIRALAAAEWNQRQNQTEKMAHLLNRAREELATTSLT